MVRFESNDVNRHSILIKIQFLNMIDIFFHLLYVFGDLESFFLSTFFQELSPCGWIGWNDVVAFASEPEALLGA